MRKWSKLFWAVDETNGLDLLFQIYKKEILASPSLSLDARDSLFSSLISPRLSVSLPRVIVGRLSSPTSPHQTLSRVRDTLQHVLWHSSGTGFESKKSMVGDFLATI
jgi:hypothetical protein